MSLKISNDNMIEEINKNTYYLNDKEVQSDHIEYCTVIMHTDDENNTFDFDQFFITETSYCHIYIMFKMIQKWKFSLWIWVIMKKKNADNKIIIIKLDCNIIKDRNVTVKLLSSEHLSLSIWHIAKMQQINDEDYIYWINVSFNFIKVLSDQLWTNLAELIELDLTFQKLQEIFISSTLKLYMHSSMNIIKFIEEFLDIIQQKRVINSLNTWHFQHSNKHFVQLNQIISAYNWSAIKLST